MKRRIIATLDWVVRLFVTAPPHPLPPPRWCIVTREDGANVFRDRYGENTDIEIITNDLVPQGEVYLIDQSYFEAFGRESFQPDLILPGNTASFLARHPEVKVPTKLIITSS